VGTSLGQQRINVIPLLSIDPAAPSVTLLPNPVSDVLQVETRLPGPHELLLFDVLGREQVRRPFQQRTQLSVQGLGRGVHVYHVLTPQGALLGKIVVE
jgi:hypothetical protein